MQLARLATRLLLIALAAFTPASARSIHGATATSLPDSSNIVAHFDAGAIGGTNNTAFSTWTDTVNGIVATQATGANQPIFTSNRLNGKPSAKFPGNNFLTIASPGALKTAIDSQVSTVLIVFRTLGSTSVGMLFGSSGTQSAFNYVADGTGVGRSVSGLVPDAGQTSFSVLGSTCTASSGGSSPIYESVFVNGGMVGPNIPFACPTSGSGTFSIGSDSTNIAPTNAEIFDIVVWKTTLTPTQVLQGQMWAADKYGQAYPWAGVSAFTIFDGDSITANVCATNIAGGYPYKTAQALGLAFGQWSNIGVGGITIAQMDTLAPTRVDNVSALINKNIHLAAFEWFNQKGPSPTPFNNSATYTANRKAASARTFIAFGDSTDDTTAGDETNRAAYNSAVASITNVDQHVTISTNSNIGVSGSAANTSFFCDGVHPIDAGYSVLAPLFTTGLQALPFLLKRDIDPASNDNDPMWLNKSA